MSILCTLNTVSARYVPLLFVLAVDLERPFLLRSGLSDPAIQHCNRTRFSDDQSLISLYAFLLQSIPE